MKTRNTLLATLLAILVSPAAVRADDALENIWDFLAFWEHSGGNHHKTTSGGSGSGGVVSVILDEQPLPPEGNLPPGPYDGIETPTTYNEPEEEGTPGTENNPLPPRHCPNGGGGGNENPRIPTNPTVPEPMTLLLFGSGALATGLTRLRRSR